jgi:hypothetical protein
MGIKIGTALAVIIVLTVEVIRDPSTTGCLNHPPIPKVIITLTNIIPAPARVFGDRVGWGKRLPDRWMIGESGWFGSFEKNTGVTINSMLTPARRSPR